MRPATQGNGSNLGTRSWLGRLIGQWWRRQSVARQDRFATFGPLASVLLFLGAIVLAFWYVRNEEFDRERDEVQRDTEGVSKLWARLNVARASSKRPN